MASTDNPQPIIVFLALSDLLSVQIADVLLSWRVLKR